MVIRLRIGISWHWLTFRSGKMKKICTGREGKEVGLKKAEKDETIATLLRKAIDALHRKVILFLSARAHSSRHEALSLASRKRPGMVIFPRLRRMSSKSAQMGCPISP